MTILRKPTSLLHFDGSDGSTNITDSYIGLPWSYASGVNISTSQSKFGESSLYLNGSSGLIYFPYQSFFNVGSGNFSIDIWVRPSSTSAGNHIIVYFPGAGTYSYILLLRDGTSYKLYSSSTGSSWNIASGATLGTAVQDTWQHLMWSRSGNTGYYSLDGTVGSIDLTGVTLMDGTGNFIIGGASDQYFDGYVDEFRFCKFSTWTSNFIPPTDKYRTSYYIGSKRDRLSTSLVSATNQWV